MKNLIISLMAFSWCLPILAQTGVSQPLEILDSVFLKEVEITETVPVSDIQIENLYKSNSCSTIDNVIGRLDATSLIRRGSYAMEPVLNGFSGGQLNITIDGMKMFGACTDRMDPITSYIEPSNLKSIKVRHGSNGCQHGSNIGGAMDLNLKEPCETSARPLSVSTSLGFESVSVGKTALLSAGYVKDKWQWGLNGAFRKNENYKDGDGNEVPFTQYEKSNLHSVLKFIPDSASSIKADFLYDLARDVGYAALPMDVSKARAYLFDIEYRNVGRIELQTKAYFNSVLHIMDDSKRDSLYYVTDRETGEKKEVYMRMDMPGTSSTAGAFIMADMDLDSRNRLTVKLDNYTNHSKAEMTMHMHYPGEPMESPMYLQTWPDMVRSVTGIYLQNKMQVSGDLAFTIHGRLDYDIDFLKSGLAKEQFSVFEYNLPDKRDQLTWSFDMSSFYTLSDPISISAEAGYSERLPTIGEWYGFYLYNAYDGYDYIGNPYLKTEKSYFGRITFVYTRPWLKANLSQSVNLVRDHIMGITDSLVPPMNFYTNGTRAYHNVPGATLLNTNLQMQVIPYHDFEIFLLTKYTWGQLDSGDPMPLIPPLNNIITVSYKLNDWEFQLENETAMAQNRINSGYGETASPAYTVFNIKCSYHLRFLKPVMTDISLAVTNLFDAQYYQHLDWGRIYRPGRSINIYLRFSF